MTTFKSLNFGCRVNAAETNQLSQQLIDKGLTFDDQNPDVVIVNTCAVTKKGEYESVHQIKKLIKDNPLIKIIATGCANLDEFKNFPNVSVVSNQDKEKLSPLYTSQIKDKFSHTHRYLLKVQSGCTTNCTFCTVPQRRPYLISTTIDILVDTVNKLDNYEEIIITGVNLAQYKYGFSNLVEALLNQTNIPLISFGSVPLLCIDEKFINLYQKYPNRLSHFLHIPLQSGSDKILKLMHRPYTKQKIMNTFSLLRSKINDLTFGTDIIVGFPTETDSDFEESYDLCKSIGFSKIHVFKYSPRPGTPARELFLKSSKLSKSVLLSRSNQIQSLISQTTLPSRQKPTT